MQSLNSLQLNIICLNFFYEGGLVISCTDFLCFFNNIVFLNLSHDICEIYVPILIINIFTRIYKKLLILSYWIDPDGSKRAFLVMMGVLYFTLGVLVYTFMEDPEERKKKDREKKEKEDREYEERKAKFYEKLFEEKKAAREAKILAQKEAKMLAQKG